jgi:NAD(P)-dependent dehydrogenase (short-subunit alcohol dehydrogenase family)
MLAVGTGGSRRMAQWTERDIPNLSGKTALVTGANSGLGFATARALAARGAHVILGCRDAGKAEAAMAAIRSAVPDAKLEFLPGDLSSLASVRAAAATVKARHSRLDIQVNNAGVMTLPYTQTPDGFEMLFGTNFLGHFALTGLLFELTRATPGARIVTVTSLSERVGRLPLDDLNWEKSRYSKRGAYARSKLANLVFALELDRRLRQAGLGVLSVAAHPGYSATNIVYGGGQGGASLMRSAWNLMARLGNTLLAQPAERGALPQLYAATMPDVNSGEYIGPDGFIEFRGWPTRVKPSRRAQDPQLGAGLWARAAAMTGVRFL